MKRRLSLGLVLLLVVSMLAIPAMAEENITLTVASFYNTGSASGWDGLVAAFNEKYPNVTVEVQESASSDYLTKLVSQLASGTSPDVIAVENGMMAKFVESNLLTSLNGYLENDSEVESSEYFPHLLDYYTVDGEIYGLPYDAQPNCMFFFNKALFDEAGVAYPNEDWTWDDMLNAAIALTKTDESGRVTQYGLLANTWKNYLYTNGGRILSDDNTTCLLDSAESISGIQFMVDLVQKYKVMPDPTTLSSAGVSGEDMFATGQIAMFCTGFWSLVDIPTRWEAIDLGLTWFPANTEGNHGWTTGGTAYCVANGSANPDLAYEFVKYFMGAQGWEAAYNAATLGIIYPPAHIPSYEKYVLNNPDMVTENVRINGDSIPYAVFNPRIPLYSEIESKIIQPTIDEIQLGYVGVEEGLQDITARVNEALECGEVY